MLCTFASNAVAQPAPPRQPATTTACPPGAYCEEAEVAPPSQPQPQPQTRHNDNQQQPQAEPGSVTVVLPPPPPGRDPYKPRIFVYRPDPQGGPGEIVIYEDGIPAPPPADYVAGHHHAGEHDNGPGVRKRKRRRRKRRRRARRFGLNLRLQGALMPRERQDGGSGGMGGLGLSFRYRPIGRFALDFGADFLAGIASNGFARQEVPLSLSAMLYLNPRSKAQFYLLGGIHWSFAKVFSERVEPNFAGGQQDAYNYFGGHGGLGIEFRVVRMLGIHIDGLLFARTRTDADPSGSFPEFYDPKTNEASNTSAAGLIRAGVTFWW